jgi:hypothetical protein
MTTTTMTTTHNLLLPTPTAPNPLTHPLTQLTQLTQLLPLLALPPCPASLPPPPLMPASACIGLTAWRPPLASPVTSHLLSFFLPSFPPLAALPPPLPFPGFIPHSLMHFVIVQISVAPLSTVIHFMPPPPPPPSLFPTRHEW